jgi:hypothetical protein
LICGAQHSFNDTDDIAATASPGRSVRILAAKVVRGDAVMVALAIVIRP